MFFKDRWILDGLVSKNLVFATFSCLFVCSVSPGPLFARMRSKGSRFTLGVWGLRVCSLDDAFTSAPVRNRSQMSPGGRVRPVWPCLWWVLQKGSLLEYWCEFPLGFQGGQPPWEGLIFWRKNSSILMKGCFYQPPHFLQNNFWRPLSRETLIFWVA